jgi:hypothetical protein
MPDERQLATSVSNRQFILLREAEKRGGLPLQRMLELSQTTGGSVVRRGFIAWNRNTETFALTRDGLAVLDTYKTFDIGRKDESLPLSSFIRKRWGNLDERIQKRQARSRGAAA